MTTNLFEAEAFRFVDVVEVEKLIDPAVLHEEGEGVMEQASKE